MLTATILSRHQIVSRLPLIKSLLLAFIIAAFAWPLSAHAQAAPQGAEPRIDAAVRQRLVDSILRQLRARYVIPEAVSRIEERLRARLRSGAYDSAASASLLGQAITQDLRTVSDDLHFDVTYDPARERELVAAGAATSQRLPEIAPSAERLAALRQANYHFRRAEHLPGNVGYIDLRLFVNLDQSRETAIAAMSFLAHTDAVVIDLRRNPGGNGNLVNFLASYFFGAEPVELASSYDRETNTTTRTHTLRELPGRRLTQTDVYILTSEQTGSAAEAFAFVLQQANRARTVGTRTAGAGHGGGWVPVGDGFIIFMPTFRAFNPRTGRGWNSTGVQPDIAAPVERALEIAHLEAVRRLAARATDENRKRQLEWLVPLLELRATGPRTVEPATLERYAGHYERAIISIEQGQLRFQGNGPRRNLYALSDGTFLIEDTEIPPENQARLRFIVNTEGAVTGLVLIAPDGRTFPRARQASSN